MSVVTDRCGSVAERFCLWAPAGAGAKSRERDLGFTLIEMMVALAVFSLAALALIRLEGATIRGAATLDTTLMAQTVARNVAFDALTDARPPTIGTATGIRAEWRTRLDVDACDATDRRRAHSPDRCDGHGCGGTKRRAFDRGPRRGDQVVRRASHNEQGFTLIEVMIALLIFGLLAAAGVALLSFAVRAQGVTGAKLDDVAAMTRLSSILTADLAQASTRQTRGGGGRVAARLHRRGGGGRGADVASRPEWVE